MMNKVITNFLNSIILFKIANKYEGCSENDLAELEKRYSVFLPKNYKDLMLSIGRECGLLVDKTEYDFYVNSLDRINDFVRKRRRLLKEEGELLIDLPDSLFFIMGRYRESFYYLEAKGQEDSLVWHYDMENEKIELRYNSVIEWANALMNDSKEAIEKGLRG